MKLSIIVFAVLAAVVQASIVPVNPITTTYPLPAVPVATSYQVITRNVNRVAVPHVYPIGYPGFAGNWGGYPNNYRFAYGYGYPYNHIDNYGFGLGYPYGYGATVW